MIQTWEPGMDWGFLYMIRVRDILNRLAFKLLLPRVTLHQVVLS